jgi:NitT/TauT family transport system substrate-binding protein
MRWFQTRRNLITAGLAAGLTALADSWPAQADEPPPETTTIRLPMTGNICFAPVLVLEELLRAEGFTDIRFVPAVTGFTFPGLVARGEIDFAASFAGTAVFHLDAGTPIMALAGLHSGCYELFAREPVRTIADLKDRSIAISTLSSSAHLYLSIMAAHVGLDPKNDIIWVTSSEVNPHGAVRGGQD